MQIFERNGQLALQFDYNEITLAKVKSMPQRRWVKSEKIWAFLPTSDNIEYIKNWFPDAHWDESCQPILADIEKRKEKREEIRQKKHSDFDQELSDPFKYPPFKHQKKALLLGRDCESFAYLMDQGTGKTKVVLDDAAYNYRMGRINALLVICPNSVKTNWVDPYGGEDEVGKHMAPDIDYNKGCWFSSHNSETKKSWSKFQSRLKDDCLQILSINVESLHVDRIFNYCMNFVSSYKTMIVVDESTKIKNRAAKRTKNVFKLGKLAPLRRIMSGTPIIKSPLNAYAQFRFLDEDILGFATYSGFQHHFAVMGGFQGYQILYYQNLEELSNKIDPVSFRVMKEDCLDLPPKTYVKRSIEMTGEQRVAYNDMLNDSIVYLDKYTEEHGTIAAPIVLTQLLRLQQITAGFLPVLNEMGEQEGVVPIGKTNPKIEEAIEIIHECQHKVIVWCRFKAEIHALSHRLKKEGIDHVLFYGDVNEQDRISNRRRFQDPSDPVKVFVGQVNTGGLGITLHQARTVIYLSNSFSTEDRVQSEDRAHRIGQTHPVEYIDLTCPGTIDVKIIQTLRNNKSISDEILKDGFREWI